MLAKAGLAVSTFTGFKSDPAGTQVDAGCAQARAQGAGLVVALGGGSALDVGKAVAALAPARAPADHYALCANPLPARPLAKICVPTTSGTGSETTRTVVLSSPSGAKVWLWGAELKADAVLLDPVLTVGLPPAMTAATGIDALIHAIEATTNARAFAANDIYCLEAIRLAARHLPVAVAEPANLAARAGLQLAATFAGIGIDNSGTAIAHNIGHALASLRPVHHGRAVALGMRATLAWTGPRPRAGRSPGGAGAWGGGASAAALPGLFETLLRGLAIRVSLAGEGHDTITPAQLAAQMAAPENAPMRDSNHRRVDEADLLVFAETVLAQA